jgi:two-component system sensor histidine kinase and response regulator WspE
LTDLFEDLSMLDLFRIEMENYSKLLEAGLVDVEQDQTSGRIEPLMRAAHSIKGAARLVGLDVVVTLAHAMEDVLSAAQHGTHTLSSDHIDLLLHGNDVFLRMSALEAAAIPGRLEAESESLKTLSEAILAILSGAPVPASAQKPAIEPKVAASSAGPASSPEKDLPAQRSEGKPKKEAPLMARPAEKEEKGVVRVFPDSLNRLMGYAGECMVQAKSAKPLSTSLLKMKESYMEVTSGLESIFNAGKTLSLPRETQEEFAACLAGLDRIREALVGEIVDLELFSRNLERLADKIYGEVVGIRMRPFSDGVHGFPRMVRDLAKNMGKKVRFRIVGESTKVDRDVLEKLEAPLTHLLRNAIDHGLETPEERQAAGKAEEGNLVVEARHSSGLLNIRVADDGKGIDVEKLRQKVLEKGHISPEMAGSLTGKELLDFLFLPGFSTASKVTEVSGRGVGLDVVMSMVEEVGGSVVVETKPGMGTMFNLLLPLTLSVLRALLVDIGGEPYAVPLTRIDHIVECSPDRLGILEDKQFYTYENENVGIVDAHQVLQVPAHEGARTVACIVIVSDRLNRYGLVVDRFMGQREFVVIPLDARLGKVPSVSAGALLEDGSPVLILDVDDLVRSVDNLLTHGRLFKVGGRTPEAAAKKRVLVVDDSLTVREVERRLLENSGYEVTVAVDGMDGWNALQLGRFDLVVSDIDMPRMNGIELIRKIKSDPDLKETPVIVVSYKDREEDRLRGLDAGANYYLTKGSFRDRGLTNAVRDLIGEP